MIPLAPIPLTPDFLAERLAGLDRLVGRLMKEWNVPGLALGIVDREGMVFSRGYGQRDRERNLPVTPATNFAVCSCTKAFTATAIGILADDGLIEWDRPIREFVPAFRMAGPVLTKRLTVRDLLCHRSGVPDAGGAWIFSTDSRARLVERIRHHPPNADLRAVYQYNNLLYMRAGHLIEEIAGQTWEDFVRERVFAPLGMTRSRFATDPLPPGEEFSNGHVGDNPMRPIVPFAGGSRLSSLGAAMGVIGPAGTIVSNLVDMGRWVRMHLNRGLADQAAENAKDIRDTRDTRDTRDSQRRKARASAALSIDSMASSRSIASIESIQSISPISPPPRARVISEANLAEVHRPIFPMPPMEYGGPEIFDPQQALGLVVAPYRGRRLIFHTGCFGGFKSIQTFFPAEGFGVIVLTNSMSHMLETVLPFTIFDRLLGVEPAPWEKRCREEMNKWDALMKSLAGDDGNTARRSRGTRPPHPLSDYAGRFEHPGYGPLGVEARKYGLAVTFHDFTLRAKHDCDDSFQTIADPRGLSFGGFKMAFHFRPDGRVESVSAAVSPFAGDVSFAAIDKAAAPASSTPSTPSTSSTKPTRSTRHQPDFVPAPPRGDRRRRKKRVDVE